MDLIQRIKPCSWMQVEYQAVAWYVQLIRAHLSSRCFILAKCGFLWSNPKEPRLMSCIQTAWPLDRQQDSLWQSQTDPADR